MGHYSSFIIRLWVDPPEGFRWGLIQHVGSRQEQRFNTLQDMLDFMLQHADAAELSIPFSLDSSAMLSGQDGAQASDGATQPQEQEKSAQVKRTRPRAGRGGRLGAE